MKSEKGVTLAGLAAYIVILTLALGGFATILTFFSGNYGRIKKEAVYAAEYNKFMAYLVKDSKEDSLVSVADNTIKFNNSTYVYDNTTKEIRRGNVCVCENVDKFIPSIENEGTVQEVLKFDLKIGTEETFEHQSIIATGKYEWLNS